MIALLSAQRTGQGQYVDTAMVDGVLAVSEIVVNVFDALGTAPAPMGNTLQGFAPFDVVPAKDGVIALGAPHRSQWVKLCTIMGRPELIDDPRFATDDGRWRHRDEVYAIVNAWTARHTRAELVDLLGGKVPLGPILDAEEIFEDPHFQARQMLPEVENPRTGRPSRVTGPVAKLSRTPGEVRHRAPLLGEHGPDILRELGYTDERIDALLQAQATRALAAPVAG